MQQSFEIALIASIVLTLIYITRWHRHFSISFSLTFVLIVVSEIGYYLQSIAVNLEEMICALKIIYIGGCFLGPIMLLLVLDQCHIKVKKWIIYIIFFVAFVMYSLALTIGSKDWFYSNIELVDYMGFKVMKKTYGSVHNLYIIYELTYMLLFAFFLLKNLKNRAVSKKNLFILLVQDVINAAGYLFGRIFFPYIEVNAYLYPVALVIFLIVVDRVSLYDVEDTVASSISQSGVWGCINIDLNKKYLASNKAMLKFIPELSSLVVDREIPFDKQEFSIIEKWIAAVDEAKAAVEETWYKEDNFWLKVKADYLYDDHFIRGYQIRIRDNTKELKYIELINKYNAELEEAVSNKTKHIMEMSDKLILSMADMVENRDANTGGHIKRTSKVVKILIDEMKKDSELNLSDEFENAMIKAAPMHDLGKIAVDDAILRKPGKFTDEEYNIMKLHAAKGGEIVHNILNGIEDKYFMQIAENVAHYHHERMDGSGYPMGLKGDEIPLEARIMAIADVYDALVSKRCYKDSMSFEEAFEIIEKGMGTHFDSNLNKYFINCKAELEEYYRQQA